MPPHTDHPLVPRGVRQKKKGSHCPFKLSFDVGWRVPWQDISNESGRDEPAYFAYVTNGGLGLISMAEASISAVGLSLVGSL